LQISDDELVDAPTTQPSSTPIDQSKIDAAIAIWRSAPPGKGNREFFMLGVRLWHLGLDHYEIEVILKQQAEIAPRSRNKRKRQIPSIIKSLARARTH
jgi:hypothetical protein